MRRDALGAPTRVLNRPRNAAFTRTGTDDKLAIRDGLLQCVDNTGIFHDIDRRGRPPGRLGRWIFYRRDQCQTMQSHVFHRTRHATDIAAVCRVHEHNVDIIWVHLAVTLQGDAVYQNRIRFSPALL